MKHLAWSFAGGRPRGHRVRWAPPPVEPPPIPDGIPPPGPGRPAAAMQSCTPRTVRKIPAPKRRGSSRTGRGSSGRAGLHAAAPPAAARATCKDATDDCPTSNGQASLTWPTCSGCSTRSPPRSPSVTRSGACGSYMAYRTCRPRATLQVSGLAGPQLDPHAAATSVLHVHGTKVTRCPETSPGALETVGRWPSQQLPG